MSGRPWCSRYTPVRSHSHDTARTVCVSPTVSSISRSNPARTCGTRSRHRGQPSGLRTSAGTAAASSRTTVPATAALSTGAIPARVAAASSRCTVTADPSRRAKLYPTTAPTVSAHANGSPAATRNGPSASSATPPVTRSNGIGSGPQNAHSSTSAPAAGDSTRSRAIDSSHRSATVTPGRSATRPRRSMSPSRASTSAAYSTGGIPV